MGTLTLDAPGRLVNLINDLPIGDIEPQAEKGKKIEDIFEIRSTYIH